MTLAKDLKYWAFTKARVTKVKYDRLLHSPQALVDAIVQEAVGSFVIGKVQITKGETNEAYSVNLQDGRNIIVRVSRRENSRFQTERWAIEQCAKAGVPTPRVLAVESSEHNGRPLHISIETRIHGTPLDEVANGDITSQDLAKLLRKTGAILSRIHSVETNGFGELDESGNGALHSIREMLEEGQFNGRQFLRIAKSVDFDSKIVEKALDIISEYSIHYPAVSPRLIHNDIAPSHVMVSGGQISGIIDFEIAQGGDPIRELARWQFYWEKGYPLQHLIEGYENRSLFDCDFERRLHLWKVYTGLINLNWYFNMKNKRHIELCKERLTQDIRQFG